MLQLNGLNINTLPFEDLRLLQEILVFEDIPVLLHYTDARNADIISYLVDFDESGKRQLFAKIKKDELFDYLVGRKSLKTLFSEIKSDFIFYADFDKKNNVSSVTLISKYLIPEKYFPINDSFYHEEMSDFYLEYLKENYYEYRLKLNSFIFKVESADDVHGKTVSAKDAAFVLTNATSSVEGYVKVKSFNALKNDFGNVNKIKKESK